MSYPVSPIVALAKQEVGYLEKETNSRLDSKTANAGDENYTKYARDLYAVGYYNGNKNGYAWCDVFVDWLFYKIFGKTDGQRLQCQTGDLGAGCEFSARYYEKAGRLHNTPKIGDQIFFKNGSGEICHTGIVIDITDTTVITVEGNTSSAYGVVANGGCVAEKSYPLNYARIYKYGRPKYDNYDVVASKDNKTTKNGGTCTVELPVLKKGSNNGYVKTLQILLNKYDNAKVSEDGDFGAQTHDAVLSYQRSRGLYADGIVGEKTWAFLLK